MTGRPQGRRALAAAALAVCFVFTAGAAPQTPHSDAGKSWPTPWRSDVVDIPLSSADGDGAELEYKVKMKTGATLIYSWTVEAPEEEFYTDFHGQTLPASPGGAIRALTYRQEVGTKDSGSLVAPMDGVHGWYLQNQSVKPVVVHLRIAGFYELVPAGQIGNENGIAPKSSTVN